MLLDAAFSKPSDIVPLQLDVAISMCTPRPFLPGHTVVSRSISLPIERCR